MTGKDQSARWYFERLQPSGTLVAVEPDGTRHTIPHGDLQTAGGVRLLNRMTEALSSMAAPATCVDPMCACRGGPCAECDEGQAIAAQASVPDQARWCLYVAGMIGAYLGWGVEDERSAVVAGIIERRIRSLPRFAAQAAHVGGTRFEGWLSCHEPDRDSNRTPRYSKQDMRDAYWAGYCERGAA
ncbi:hypothetical protein [Ralstonia sp.]|uniref:hypothetical protein n=1 Tax=Ralstonia sp. TaxID=54061 RepID=UPI00257BAE4D|nr:hypothetical protein [Ralstonia sp.]MBA4203229.1 hypothetical protein [Ralstonia sp.]